MISARRCLRAPVALLVAVLAVLLVACSGGGDSAKPAAAKVPNGSTLRLTQGTVDIAAAGAPGTLSDADRAAILNTLQRYVVAATIDPLHGKPVGNLATMFTPEAAAALTGADRAAVVDDGMPKATAVVKATTPPVSMVALSDATGAIDLVGTSLYLDVNTKTSGGPVRVLRTGELLFKRNANAWRISSYRVSVNRTGSGLPAATTSSTEKTAP